MSVSTKYNRNMKDLNSLRMGMRKRTNGSSQESFLKRGPSKLSLDFRTKRRNEVRRGEYVKTKRCDHSM